MSDTQDKPGSALGEQLRMSILDLCHTIDEHHERLSGIGLITTDDVLTLGAFFLLEGDLPVDAGPYQKLSPVEWERSAERSFAGVNAYLRSTRPPRTETTAEYTTRVDAVFDACASVLEDLNLRERFGADLYLTFTGVDPNPTLLAAERRFVERLNPKDVFDEWCVELG